jgi:mono/diheme cytochrome c family protein
VKPFTDESPKPEDGRAVYLRACASCHGDDARGWGPVAPSLRVPPSDLTTLRARRGRPDFPRDEVIGLLSGERELPAHGTREMPVWSQRFGPGAAGAAPAFYARRRLEALVDYLAAIQRD